eukprot:SAG11_NODE_2336_length_3502_cov_6.183368_4_plen_79_part_00
MDGGLTWRWPGCVQGFWTNHSKGTNIARQKQNGPLKACKPYSVFNLSADPSEHVDLSASRPNLLASLLRRFDALSSEY